MELISESAKKKEGDQGRNGISSSWVLKICLSLAALHEEPYIMFSTEKKSMLCINCFRDMPV